MSHRGRVVATDERNYALKFCEGTLTVEPERLVVQGAPHDNGRDRKPVITARGTTKALRLTFGLLGGATLKSENTAGYRNCVIRVGTSDARPLLDDLQAKAWPVDTKGLRRPR